MRWTDYALLTILMVFLCGADAISGRPLTLHEARLPQTSREMMRSGNWLIPTSGGRPWLERPPLPHWIMITTAYATDTQCDTEWSVRIAPGLMALIVVLLTAWMADVLFDRNIALASGLILATMFEFYRYATLAEDDIFLAAVVVGAMALFVRMEFLFDPQALGRRTSIFGWRPWPVVAFFILLGLTNMAKGPIVGAAVVLGTTGVFLLIQKQWLRIKRYLWLWGILAAAVIGFSWHIWIQRRFPEYWSNLRYDFSDTEEFNNPWWYYPPNLLFLTLPWSPAAIIALFLTWRGAWREKQPNLRFLWCWAIVPIIVLSLAHRKHHHYLVPSLAPWAILAALGVKPIAQHMFQGPAKTRKISFGLMIFGAPGAITLAVLAVLHIIPGPFAMTAALIAIWLLCVIMFYRGLWIHDARWLMAAMILGFSVLYSWGQRYWPNADVQDTQFTREAEADVPRDKLLAVDGDVGPLDFFRLQFYLRPDAMLLQNLTYLRSNQIHSPDIYIISRAKFAADLSQYGTSEQILQSTYTRRETSPADRFTLFHLIFSPDLSRYDPPPVSPMQAMMRESGPFCGPAPVKTRASE